MPWQKIFFFSNYCRSSKRERKHKSGLSQRAYTLPGGSVPEQGGVSKNYGFVGHPRSRSLCHKTKSAGRDLLFSRPRGISSGGRCPFDNLALEPGLCISSSPSYSQGTEKNQVGQGENNSNKITGKCNYRFLS